MGWLFRGLPASALIGGPALCAPADGDGKAGEEPEEGFGEAGEPDFSEPVSGAGKGICRIRPQRQEGQMEEPSGGGEGSEEREQEREPDALGEGKAEAAAGVAEAECGERAVLVPGPGFGIEGRRLQGEHGVGDADRSP